MSSFSGFLPTVQALVQCYQAFEACSDSHIRTLGLTPPQFDIVATLGNTPGMTSKALSEKTLITKGTLTGVIDRLVERGWVERAAHDRDRRCQTVRLTPAGEAVFARVFPAHMEHMATHFAGVAEADHKRWQGALHALRDQLKKEKT